MMDFRSIFCPRGPRSLSILAMFGIIDASLAATACRCILHSERARLASRFLPARVFGKSMTMVYRQKSLSPLLGEFFYKRGFDLRATTAIGLDEVYQAVVSQCLRKC